MVSSVKSPKHPAEKSPDSNIRGTVGTFPSRLAALLPSFMRSLHHGPTASGRREKLGRQSEEPIRLRPAETHGSSSPRRNLRETIS